MNAPDNLEALKRLVDLIMRGKLWILTFIVSMLAVACSDRDFNSEESPEISVAPQGKYYIFVNIKAPTGELTRGDGNGDWTYEEGDGSENKINSIRFYFFDNTGENVNLLAGNSSSETIGYYDWMPESGDIERDENDGDNLEETASALLAVRFVDDAIPSQVIAVVNPTSALNNLQSPTLSEIENFHQDFTTGLTDENFVMSNSTYLVNESGDGDLLTNTSKVVCATPILGTNLCKTQAEAYKNPVEINVERIAARLDLAYKMEKKIPEPSGRTLYKTELTINPDGGTAKDVYVEFLGWAITSTPRSSRLLKKVDTSWNPNEFFSSSVSWNRTAHNRSFWGLNLPESDMDYNWYSFEQIAGTPQNQNEAAYCYSMDIPKAYMQENVNPYSENKANPANPLNPTKVIFAARLTDENGEKLEFAEYESKQYSVEGLKNLIANRLDLYCQNGVENGKILYRKILPEELDFETSFERNGETKAGDSYNVYFKLHELVQNIDWYHYVETQDKDQPQKVSDPNAYISEVTFPAKIWSKGQTYYYFAIPHCQELEKGAPGYYGVLRNNIYNAAIEGITTLGTPVYKPEEVIRPETPDKTDNQLVIKVKTMPWRLERDNLQLIW